MVAGLGGSAVLTSEYLFEVILFSSYRFLSITSRYTNRKMLTLHNQSSIFMKLTKHILIALMMLLPLFSYGQVVIEMEQDAGVYKVPCKVNGLKLKFIFDTGASSVSISSTVADMMLENDYLSKNDILGSGYSQIADGKIVDHTRINLKTIEIGGLVLHDVEAVVMHQQSAPLLLGQSAIQKLGKVSISGNKLTITSYGTTNPYSSKQTNYSVKDLDAIYDEADMYRKNGDYRLAVEKYDIVYNAGHMFLFDIIRYARCLGDNSVGRYEDALDVLLRYEEDVISDNYSTKEAYYYEICKQAYWAKEYDMCIKYGGLAKAQMPYPLHNKWLAAYWIASSYEKTGNNYQARNELSSFISSYLKYMEISATDCWDKEYRDSSLGDMYNSLAFFNGSTYADGKKFFIIAAAWGNSDAIETCKKFDWSYLTKPYDYVY